MYIVGVDGGGTKTETAFADLNGEVIKTVTGRPSSMRNIGWEQAVVNVAETMAGMKEVCSLFVGLPAFAEEYGEKKEQIEKMLREKLADVLTPEAVVVAGSDQEVAFRSGSDKKDGVVVIAGTGSVARGWNGDREVKVGGWGWLVDKGGALQIGIEAVKRTVEAFDGRRMKSSLTEKVMEHFQAQHVNDINRIIYQKDRAEFLAPLAITANELVEEDEVAREIITQAADSLADSYATALRQLNFTENFPVVLAGSMFKSELFMDTFRRKAERANSLAEIIIPTEKPVYGAVLLAKNNYDKKNEKR